MKISEAKKWWQNEWLWLLPAVAACLVCYSRFPELHNDDHPAVIQHIAETGCWPQVEQFRSAQHMLYYHMVSAGLYRFLVWAKPILKIPPARAGQMVSLICMFGLMALLIPILRILIHDFRARVLSLLIFGASTRWMTVSVTIDNDTVMALIATLALFLTIRMMRRTHMPSWGEVLLIALIIGIAGAIKHNGQQFVIPLMGCLIGRRWWYRENMSALMARAGVSLLVVLIVSAPFYLRHYRETGRWIYHDQGFHRENWSGDRWEFFTFRFGKILRRPSIPYENFTDERLCPADVSWFSKLYMNWWSLPDFLPERPSAPATRAVFITALPITIFFLAGFIMAIFKIRDHPGWLPPLSWIFIIFIFVFLASIFFPEPRWACHTYPRMWLGGAGGLLAAFGLIAQTLINYRPATRWILYLLLGLQVAAFWWLLLSGPFYSFYDPWPLFRM